MESEIAVMIVACVSVLGRLLEGFVSTAPVNAPFLLPRRGDKGKDVTRQGIGRVVSSLNPNP